MLKNYHSRGKLINREIKFYPDSPGDLGDLKILEHWRNVCAIKKCHLHNAEKNGRKLTAPLFKK